MLRGLERRVEPHCSPAQQLTILLLPMNGRGMQTLIEPWRRSRGVFGDNFPRRRELIELRHVLLCIVTLDLLAARGRMVLLSREFEICAHGFFRGLTHCLARRRGYTH